MLTIVPTPLGNLEDVTVRALRVLRGCDLVLCEDTRRTVKLLNRYSISKKLARYNERDERSVSEAAALLRAGKNLALVSDGGMPCISDPGWRLVALARAEGLPVSVLPGPSAVVTAAAGSGLPADSFVFLGFLPRARGRILKALRPALELGRTVILYESPFRINKFADLVCAEFGRDTRMALARELTKVYEEWLTGTAGEVRDRLAASGPVKGELVVLLRSASARDDSSGAEGEARRPVMFVCSGNTCRSVMAMYYAAKAASDRGLDRDFSSCGLAADPAAPSPAQVAAVLEKEGVPFSGHSPESLTRELAEEASLILVMTRSQKAAVLDRFPAVFDKTFTLLEYAGQGEGDVPDPFGGDEAVYEAGFRRIKKAVDAVLNKLAEKELK